ncbi:MAG: glycosyltransferase family 61 protein, partial [Bacteroidetes bacterium]|nr:glycosyltransferase family 61 protein [Bacteroidota bacterium]
THLGIGKDRILESQWHPHIQAEELIVPSLPGDTGQFPTWPCKWVQKKFWPEKLEKPFRRIYLNRNKVSYRKVSNEPELEAFLAERGFESIAPENLSVMEQAKLLSEAEAVMCPHGAGLTNIVFCQPGTKIIELLHHSAVNEMYWVISNAIGLDYSYLLSEGERPEDYVDPYENFVDMSFPLDDLGKLLDEIGLK